MRLTSSNFTKVAALLAIAVSSYAPNAQARTVGAGSGRPVAAADGGCFSLFGGGIRNDCSATKNFEITLAYDWYDEEKEITVTHTPGTQCYAFSNTGWSAGSKSPVARSTTPQPVLGFLTTYFRIYAPAAGVLVVGCSVAPGGRVHRVEWNE